MSTSATGPSTSAPAGASPKAFVMTARITLALIAVQFGLAGLAAYRGLGGGDTEDTWWGPHVMLGYLIGLLTLLVVAMAFVGRLGATAVRWTAVAAVLALIGQPALGILGDDVSPWFGLLHALNAVVIAALLGTASARVTPVVTPVTSPASPASPPSP